MKVFHVAALTLAAFALPPASSAESPTKGPNAVAATNSIVGPALYVSDMTRSLEFYRDVLGMTVRMQFGPEDRPDVVIGFGTDPRLPALMLLSDRIGPEPRRIEHGHGYDRFAMNVAHLPQVRAKLRTAGYETSEIKKVHGGYLMMMATDPDGYKVELLDSKPVK